MSIIFIVLSIVVLLFVVGLYSPKGAPAITNFAECVAAGNPVMESYPEQCAADGQTFTNPNQSLE